MKKSIRLRWVMGITIAAICAASSARADVGVGRISMESQKVASGITVLNGIYKQILGSTGADVLRGSDISQACIMVMFRDLSANYLQLLEGSTGVTADKVGTSLMEYGRSYIDSARNLNIYEYYRNGVTQAVKREIKVAQDGGRIQAFSYEKLSLEYPDIETFVINTNLCVAPEFIKSVTNGAVPVDFLRPLPKELLSANKTPVMWEVSPKGGIHLVTGQNPRVGIVDIGDNVGIVPIVGSSPARVVEKMQFEEVPSDLSYVEFLSLIGSQIKF